MKVLIYLVFSLFCYGLLAKECPSSMKKTLKKNGIRIVECQVIKNSILEKKIKHIIVIRDEGIAGRGVGVEIFSSKDLKKPIFQDFGLGQVLGNFQLNDKRSEILVKDIDGDGINEFGFNVLNERSALFFMYQYDAKIKSYKTINFKRNFKGNLQTMDHLVSTLDWPIEVLTDKIKVWYEKEKFITYKLKDGEYFSDMD
jgi:hypothetical protein